MKLAYSNHGFTLIEMLVVLAIMAATLAISLPFVRTSGDARRLEATAQIVAARLRQTQASAVESNAERLFKIDLKHGQILDPVYILPEGTDLYLETSEGQVAHDMASVRFFADGGSTGGKITLSKGSDRWDISINWLDGAVVTTKVMSP
jgi:general secretion pathway protein H